MDMKNVCPAHANDLVKCFLDMLFGYLGDLTCSKAMAALQKGMPVKLNKDLDTSKKLLSIASDTDI